MFALKTIKEIFEMATEFKNYVESCPKPKAEVWGGLLVLHKV